MTLLGRVLEAFSSNLVSRQQISYQNPSRASGYCCAHCAIAHCTTPGGAIHIAIYVNDAKRSLLAWTCCGVHSAVYV
jgi:hypothetical protein